MWQRVLLVSLLLLAIVSFTSGLSLSIAAHREECFFDQVTAGTDLGLVFQVTSGGFLDIDVRILGPDDQEIYEGKKEKEGKYFFIAAQDGFYKFCFSNRMSTMTPKVVSFDIKVGKGPSDIEQASFVDEQLQPAVMQLADGIASIAGEEKYMRQREEVHRDTTESTNARVLWWSVLEFASLLGMSVFQIVSLRRMFEVRRPV